MPQLGLHQLGSVRAWLPCFQQHEVTISIYATAYRETVCAITVVFTRIVLIHSSHPIDSENKFEAILSKD